MKWFKHDTNARNDLRLKLLKKKFGVEGYGVYFSLLEIIGEFAQKNNVKEWGFVDKLHTTETLAEEIGIDPVKLDEIFAVCNELGLFTQKEKRLYCEKILTRLDEYAEKIKQQHDKIVTLSRQTPENVALEGEEEREENKKKKENIYNAREYLLKIPETDLDEFSLSFTCTKNQVKTKGEELFDYCKRKGRIYKDYKAFLRSALRRDYGKRVATVNGLESIKQKESEYLSELQGMRRTA